MIGNTKNDNSKYCLAKPGSLDRAEAAMNRSAKLRKDANKLRQDTQDKTS